MSTVQATSHQRLSSSTTEPLIIRLILITLSLLFLGVFLVLPLVSIFITAFQKGWETYVASITHPDALAAIQLTLIVTLIVVPLNTIFGIAAAWCITKFSFKGKNLLITLIDYLLPFLLLLQD